MRVKLEGTITIDPIGVYSHAMNHSQAFDLNMFNRKCMCWSNVPIQIYNMNLPYTNIFNSRWGFSRWRSQ